MEIAPYKLLEKKNIADCSSGNYVTLFLTKDGKVMSKGFNLFDGLVYQSVIENKKSGKLKAAEKTVLIACHFFLQGNLYDLL